MLMSRVLLLRELRIAGGPAAGGDRDAWLHGAGDLLQENSSKGKKYEGQ